MLPAVSEQIGVYAAVDDEATDSDAPLVFVPYDRFLPTYDYNDLIDVSSVDMVSRCVGRFLSTCMRMLVLSYFLSVCLPHTLLTYCLVCVPDNR